VSTTSILSHERESSFEAAKTLHSLNERDTGLHHIQKHTKRTIEEDLVTTSEYLFLSPKKATLIEGKEE
jgi:hypothetical protein